MAVLQQTPVMPGVPMLNSQAPLPAPTVNTGAGGGIVTPPTGMTPPPGAVGTQPIDINDRGQRITFNPTVGQAPQVAGQQIAGPGDTDFNQGLDPSGFKVNADGRGFQVTPQSVMQQAMEAFQAQIPGMNLDLADQANALGQRTAAMGRTGSGLFNRGTNEISDRGRATREGLLGNLAFGAAGQDAANSLQAQIATGGFQQSGLDRLLRGELGSAQNALQAALAGQQGTMEGARLGQQAELANQDVDLRSQLANQAAGSQDINRALEVAMQQMGLGERQQGREDQMARQAQSDIFQQLAMMQQGFAGSPESALNSLANFQAGGGQEAGANAAQTSGQLGALGTAAGGFLGDFFNRPQQVQIPARPAPVPEPQVSF